MDSIKIYVNHFFAYVTINDKISFWWAIRSPFKPYSQPIEELLFLVGRGVYREITPEYALWLGILDGKHKSSL